MKGIGTKSDNSRHFCIFMLAYIQDQNFTIGEDCRGRKRHLIETVYQIGHFIIVYEIFPTATPFKKEYATIDKIMAYLFSSVHLLTIYHTVHQFKTYIQYIQYLQNYLTPSPFRIKVDRIDLFSMVQTLL